MLKRVLYGLIFLSFLMTIDAWCMVPGRFLMSQVLGRAVIRQAKKDLSAKGCELKSVVSNDLLVAAERMKKIKNMRAEIKKEQEQISKHMQEINEVQGRLAELAVLHATRYRRLELQDKELARRAKQIALARAFLDSAD